MNRLIIVTMVLIGLFTTACEKSSGNSQEGKTLKNKVNKEDISKSVLIGEWECIDITDGAVHMRAIAKMQPHMVFTADNKIMNKMKLPDGSAIQQKLSNYKIENGQIISKIFDENVYMENGNLIVENPSQDSKQIFRKVQE